MSEPPAGALSFQTVRAFILALVIALPVVACGSVPDISFPSDDASANVADALAVDALAVDADASVDLDSATNDGPICAPKNVTCTHSQDCCSGNCVNDRGVKTCN